MCRNPETAQPMALWPNGQGVGPRSRGLQVRVLLFCRCVHPSKSFRNQKSLDARPTGPVAQWIRHRPTEPGIVGSSPTGVMHTCDTVVSFSVSSQNQITSVDVSGIFSSVVCNHQWLNFKRTLSKLSPSTPQHGGWPASSAASSTQVDHYQCVGILKPLSPWPSGPMDKASALGAGEYRFESCCSVVESTQVNHFCVKKPATRTH